MKIFFFLFLLFFSYSLHADGPSFRHKETRIQQEFENAYQDIRSNKFNAGSPFYSYSATITGISSSPSYSAKYSRVGKLCVIAFKMDAATSNSTSFTVSLPFRSANNGMHFYSVGYGGDNGVEISTPINVQIPPNSTSIFLYKTWNGTGWTASGTKFAAFNIFYEVE